MKHRLDSLRRQVTALSTRRPSGDGFSCQGDWRRWRRRQMAAGDPGGLLSSMQAEAMALAAQDVQDALAAWQQALQRSEEENNASE